MDRWGPKQVELTYVMNKTYSLKHFVYLVGLHIYYKMIHGPYNIKEFFIRLLGLIWLRIGPSARPLCTRYRTVDSNPLAWDSMPFGGQFSTLRRVICLHPQSQAVHVVSSGWTTVPGRWRRSVQMCVSPRPTTQLHNLKGSGAAASQRETQNLRGNGYQIFYYLRDWQFVERNYVPFPHIRVTKLKRERRNKQNTGCFTTLGHNCRRWFPRSLWSKKFI